MGGKRLIAFLVHIFLIVMSIVANTASATNRYVSLSGSNTPPYSTWSTAAWFLEIAHEDAEERDTIFLDSGAHYVSLQINLKRGITLVGKGVDSTEVFGKPLAHFMFVLSDSNSCKDIRFRANGCGTTFFKYLYDQPNVFRAESCDFFGNDDISVFLDRFVRLELTNCRFDGWNFAAVGAHDTGDVLIQDCTFSNNNHIDATCEFETNLGERIIQNNVFTHCGDTYLSGNMSFGRLTVKNNLMYDVRWGRVGMTTVAPHIEIANNTMVFEGFLPTWASFVPLAINVQYLDTLMFYNNIAVGFQPLITYGGAMPQSAIANVYYNCFWSRTPWTDSLCIPNANSYDTVSNNIYRDPMLVDPVGGDFGLQLGSPCIDAGVPWLLDKDGSRSDMGVFGGPAGTFYVYQDLAPSVPLGLTGERESSQVSLRWTPTTESDIRYYRLYRSSHLPVDENNADLVAEVNFDFFSVATWSDLDSEFVTFTDWSIQPNLNYYYAVAAVDSNYLASSLSTPVSFVVTDVENPSDDVLPNEFALEQNYPNPFNAITAIVYNLPSIGAQPASVQLIIYNSLGQKVKTLVDQRQNSGQQIAYWDGTDDNGQSVASGIYFYSLNVSGVEFAKKRKMVLMK